jgi:hypothetical protein
MGAKLFQAMIGRTAPAEICEMTLAGADFRPHLQKSPRDR